MTKIQPTPGRIVWVFHRNMPVHVQPTPGIIVRVHRDGLVDVHLFDGSSEPTIHQMMGTGISFSHDWQSQIFTADSLRDLIGRLFAEVASLNKRLCDCTSGNVVRLTIHDAGTGRQSTADQRWAEWMPYQMGQAARTEAAEAKIAPCA